MKPTEVMPHPSDWRAVTVGEAVEVKRGVSWSKDQEQLTPHDDTMPVIGISNVQERLELNHVLHLSGVKPAVAAKKRVSAGWSILVGSNGNRNRIGNAVLIREDTEFLFASFLLAARPKLGTSILPEFFFRWLISEPVQGYISASSEGSTGLNNLSHSFFRSMTVAFPSVEEQSSIVRMLDAADDAVDRAREALVAAEEFDHAMLHELLEGDGQKHQGKSRSVWRFRRVDEVAAVGTGITLGADLSGFKVVDLPYLRVANVQDGHLDLSSIKTVKVRVEDVDSYRLEPGDVLMTEGGDIDKLGRGTLWQGELPICLHQNHIFRVRANAEHLDPLFFALIVESDIAKRYFMRVAKRTTNLASINKTQLRAFRFPVPSLPEQRDIARIMTGSKESIAALKSRLSVLSTLRRSVAYELMTGRVRVMAKHPEAVGTA